MKGLSATLMADFYKLSHREQYPPGTEKVYSTWTPRASRIPGVNAVVVFGIQGFIQEVLVEFFNENFFERDWLDIAHEYRHLVQHTLGGDPETIHLYDLHKLGYLPLRIRALPEGSFAPIRCPMMTIENTDPRFFWLPGYLETIMSTNLWMGMTSATIANEYRELLNRWADYTVGNRDHVQFQAHDFSMRGMSSVEAAARSGAGHLLSFVGTDTIPAISYLEHYYGANVETELVGTSIPATEHSVMCAYQDDEVSFKRLITEVYPKGLVSVVSDTWDLWDVIGRILPSLKKEVMARDGKLVIRPDSGDPVKIICGDPDAPSGSLAHKGVVECLWDIFGGTINERGFKVLDSHIGCIYGDSITPTRADQICAILSDKGFASSNIVFGVGSFTYQYNTRDTFGFALKSTLVVIDGKEVQIFKDPKTDDGTKRSQKGRVGVFYETDGLEYSDQHSLTDHLEGNLLQDVFVDGVVKNVQTLKQIRSKLRNLS